MTYYPDKWFLVEVRKPTEPKPFYKVFAMWYGGYAKGDSWRLNSGIEHTLSLGDNTWAAVGASGSEYICPIEVHGWSAYGYSVYTGLEEQMKVVYPDVIFKAVDDIDKAIEILKSLERKPDDSTV